MLIKCISNTHQILQGSLSCRLFPSKKPGRHCYIFFRLLIGTSVHFFRLFIGTLFPAVHRYIIFGCSSVHYFRLLIGTLIIIHKKRHTSKTYMPFKNIKFNYLLITICLVYSLPFAITFTRYKPAAAFCKLTTVFILPFVMDVLFE